MQEENTYPTHKTILELMEELGINTTVEEFAGETNPDMDGDMTPWLATYTYSEKTVSFNYYTGSAITKTPTPDEVISTVLQDVSYADTDMMDFIIEMGYDNGAKDLRKGQRVYQAIQQETAKLKEFLGEHFDAFLEAD